MTDATSSTARARLSVRIGVRALAHLQTIAYDEGVKLTDVVRVALALALEHHGAEIRTRLRNLT